MLDLFVIEDELFISDNYLSEMDEAIEEVEEVLILPQILNTIDNLLKVA